MIVKKILYRFKKSIAVRHRKPVEVEQYELPFSIISCNCIGGMVYHDLHLPFLSPTINLYMSSGDFLKFVMNLREYVQLPLMEVKDSGQKYPIAKLGDLTLHCMHYGNFAEAKECWDRRKARIDYDHIFVVMSDRDGFEDSMVEEFNHIPYRKIIYSCKKLPTDDLVFVKKDEGKKEVDDLTRYYDCSGVRTYEYYFDIYRWLTGKYTTKECLKNE